MALSPEQRQKQQQRIEDCRELYLRHGGEDHEQIERDMRAMGHTDFHRRSLYRRFERGSSEAGWIERFGWERLVRDAATSGGSAAMMSGKASPFRARDNNDPEATPPDLLDGGEAPRSFSDIDGKAEPYRSS